MPEKGESTAQALYCGAYPCRSPSASSEAEGLLASFLKRYPVMRIQFSRGTIFGTVLCFVAVVVPYNVQAQAESQSYPIAEAQAVYWEVAANAEELNARAWNTLAQAGGECEGDTETCGKWASQSREVAERYRAFAKHIRDNLSSFNEPTPEKTAQEEARKWREIADEAEGNAAPKWDYADSARRNTKLGQRVRTWTRAAEMLERLAEAFEAKAELAYVVADMWDKRAGNLGTYTPLFFGDYNQW